MRPHVTVCVPTYNGHQFLDDCLTSVRGQIFDDMEILVVDDRSTDDTVSIAQIHAASDPRIRMERNGRRYGLVGNWNRCIELARGDWLKFVFQDDLIDTACVQRLVEAGNRTGAIMVACLRRIQLDDADEESHRRYADYAGKESLAAVFPGQAEVSADDFCHAVLDHMKKNFIGEPTSLLLHRTAFERFGLFNDNLVSLCDLEFWVRVAIHAGLAIVPEPLATFRVHGAGASAVLRRDDVYRLQRLDALILLHEFAFNPMFAPLRTAARSHRPAVDLTDQFVRHAVYARRALRKMSTSREESRDWLRQWRDVTARFPRARRGFAVRRRGLLVAVGWYRLTQLLRQRTQPKQRKTQPPSTRGTGTTEVMGAVRLPEARDETTPDPSIR